MVIFIFFVLYYSQVCILPTLASRLEQEEMND